MSLYDRLQLPAKRPPVAIGCLSIEALTLEETAQAFIAYCRSEARREASRPLYSTSVNGQVISLCARDKTSSSGSSKPIRSTPTANRW